MIRLCIEIFYCNFTLKIFNINKNFLVFILGCLALDVHVIKGGVHLKKKFSCSYSVIIDFYFLFFKIT